jgi:hypothetical protein
VQNHVDNWTFLAHHDFVERCTQDTLARGGCGSWMRPCQLEIRAEPHQLLPLPFAQWWRLGGDDGSNFAFYSLHSLQRIVPAAL